MKTEEKERVYVVRESSRSSEIFEREESGKNTGKVLLLKVNLPFSH